MPTRTSAPAMLVVDLDGTLLTHDKIVTEHDLRAVRALSEAGVHVTIATGRLYSGTEHVARQLGVHGAVACMNGADLVDVASGVSFAQKGVPADQRSAIRDVLRETQIHTVLFEPRKILHDASADPYKKYLKTWSEQFDHVDDVFSSAAWGADESVLAVVGVGRADEIVAIGDEIRASIISDDQEVLAFPSLKHPDNGFLMVRSREENKGSAIQRLAERVGVDVEACVCVGDWLNDVPMLESPARSFAMGGTPDWVQDKADEVLDARTHEGGAVAELARRVWGIDVS